MVDDPIPMYRAGVREKTHRKAAVRSELAERDPVAPRREPAPVTNTATKQAPPAPQRDRGSAPANSPELASAFSTTHGVFAQGESHPDDDERLPLHSAPAEAAKVQQPAPVQRAVPAAPPAIEVSADDADIPVKPQAVADAERPALRPSPDEVIRPLAVPLYTREGRLIVPAPLKGTREILVHQNRMADAAGLSRIQDDADLDRMRAQHLLVGFPETPGLAVNEALPYNRRYARPWTVKFVTDTSRAFYARFHEPLHLNSAVRTVAYQLRLQRVNGNAASIEGDVASPHLTGQAIDFGKHGMSMEEIAWMRSYLLPLMQAGKLDVEEEFQQACFHISVYGSYAPQTRGPRTEFAQLHGERAVARDEDQR